MEDRNKKNDFKCNYKPFPMTVDFSVRNTLMLSFQTRD